MIIKQLIDEDFINYRLPSMFIAFPYCNWKCEKDCGIVMCQNKGLALEPNIEVDYKTIVNRYINNPITKAIVMGGLEAMDSAEQLLGLVTCFRNHTQDDIIIYTGYNPNEVEAVVKIFRNKFSNIIIKYGRYIPNQPAHFDEILGVNLASDNQYAIKIS